MATSSESSNRDLHWGRSRVFWYTSSVIVFSCVSTLPDAFSIVVNNVYKQSLTGKRQTHRRSNRLIGNSSAYECQCSSSSDVLE